jgi:hypothetical protein
MYYKDKDLVQTVTSIVLIMLITIIFTSCSALVGKTNITVLDNSPQIHEFEPVPMPIYESSVAIVGFVIPLIPFPEPRFTRFTLQMKESSKTCPKIVIKKDNFLRSVDTMSVNIPTHDHICEYNHWVDDGDEIVIIWQGISKSYKYRFESSWKYYLNYTL